MPTSDNDKNKPNASEDASTPFLERVRKVLGEAFGMKGSADPPLPLKKSDEPTKLENIEDPSSDSERKNVEPTMIRFDTQVFLALMRTPSEDTPSLSHLVNQKTNSNPQASPQNSEPQKQDEGLDSEEKPAPKGPKR